MQDLSLKTYVVLGVASTLRRVLPVHVEAVEAMLLQEID